MRRRVIALSGAAVLGMATLFGHPRSAGPLTLQPAQSQQPTFRGRADFVSVDVSVRQRGRPVLGLTAGDFDLFDNGTPQEIADVSYERLPIDVIVALDVSGSVTGAVLDQLRRSVQQLQADLDTRDRLKLLTFNMRIKRILDFAAPAAATDASLFQVAPSGSTAVFDTIAVALTAPTVADRRRLVVLFSDGDDSSSITDPKMLFDVARRTTPTLDVVLASSLGTGAGVSSRSIPAVAALRQMYTELTRETGGVVESVSESGNLSTAFRRVLNEFRSSYVLHFVPRGVERAGLHTLEVRVKGKGADIRARRAYSWR
jgi:Ca-activated chloride channel family protein